MSIDMTGFVYMKTKIILGSKEFTFTELSLADMAAFRAYVRTKRNKASEARRARLLADATKISNINPVELLKITDTPITEAEFEQESETMEGLGYLAYLSLKHDYPEISLENTMEILSVNVIDVITEAMFPPIDDDKKDTKKKSIKKSKSQKSQPSH